MKPFDYKVPTDRRDAVAIVSNSSNARFFAGGTCLVDLMRLGVEQPDVLVDVTKLGLATISDTSNGGILIGAGIRVADLSAEPRIQARYPMLAQALVGGASGQIRNLATIGGNLMQRTRCSYFRDITKPCNKREPGTGCPAYDGEHRNMAILGWSDSCVATHPSDMSVAMMALDARVHLHDGQVIPFRDLYRLPEATPEEDTTLEHGMLITAIELPSLSAARNSLFRKVRDRASFAFAICSVAVALLVDDDGNVSEARVAFGGLAHMPWRADRAEEILRGAPATPETFGRAALAELAQARPLRDNGFKVTLARNLMVQALLGLAR